MTRLSVVLFNMVSMQKDFYGSILCLVILIYIYSDRKSLGETFPESRPTTASLRAISPKPTPEKNTSLLFNEEADQG